MTSDEVYADRFWRKVTKTPKCWVWNRPCRSRLGPRFQYRGKDIKVARMAFYFKNGFWPTGGAVRDCGNLLCCRPSHLLDVTQDNMSEFLVVRGRHRHGMRPRVEVCKRGHKMEGKNLGVNKFQRFCRTCFNMNRRRQYEIRRKMVEAGRGVSISALVAQLSRQDAGKANAAGVVAQTNQQVLVVA